MTQRENNENKSKAGRPIGTTKMKMNKVQVESLISESVNEILSNHMSYTQYIKYAQNKWGISEAQSNEYWLRCWTLLKEKYQLERDNLINKHLASYWSIYDLAISKDDLSNARMTLNDISKLLGMAEAEKVDVKQELQIKFKFGENED